ncbi:uncharacterized protein LOC119727155 [Patiria miniata]|uniref:Uncharacterized protein n=1 Tax=Patiria miniata TaxID=46514 RepID=A0A913ZTL9_PATMI|nr:uncharacterized protein LOC119727155 [Patiria miniata]
MRLPDWTVLWMVCMVQLTSFVLANTVPQTSIRDHKDASIDDSYEEYSNIDPFHRQLMMQVYGAHRFGGFGTFRPSGNGTSGDIGSAMLKWFLGISGSAILFLVCLLMFLCRADLARCFHRIYRKLYKRWADRYAADRQAIIKDVDDEQFSTSDPNEKLVVDKIVYRAVNFRPWESMDGAKQEYTAVPPAPDSPLKDAPCLVLSNGPQQDPVKSVETTEKTDKNTEDISS